MARSKHPKPKFMPLRAAILIPIYAFLAYTILYNRWSLSFLAVVSLVYFVVAIPYILNLLSRKKLPSKEVVDNENREA